VDVFEIDGASPTGVDDILELRDNVRYLPTTGKRKIYIIDEVHMLSVSAFNALLKTLEEPPEHVTFMFATTEPHKIPATILSRCQRFDLKRVAPAELFPLLEAIVKKEKLKADSAALELLAAEASGSVRDALSLLDQVIAYVGGKKITRKLAASVMGITDRKALMAISAALLERDVDDALEVLDQVFEGGQDLVHFARSVLTHLRDLVLARVLKDPKALTRLSEEELKQVRSQIKDEPAGRLLQLFEGMSRAADDVARSEFPKMTLEMSLTELALAEPMVPVGQLVERLELLESRLIGRVPDPRGKARKAPAVQKRKNRPGARSRNGLLLQRRKRKRRPWKPLRPPTP
jgi:DNA polymerase-3 subunit gamma/tau